MTARRWVAVAATVLLALAGIAALLSGRGGSPESARTPSSASASTPAVSSTSASRPTPPHVVFIGDSWTVGIGATGGRGYAPLAAEELGWEYDVLGVSGSGYLARGLAGPYGERVDAAVALDPDLIVMQGSLNDSGVDPGQLGRATADTLIRLREAAGEGTAVLVIGAPEAPGTDPAVIARINSAIAAAADAAGVTFVDPVRENWTDPADPAIWADALHPDDAGHQRLATAVVPVLQASLDG